MKSKSSPQLFFILAAVTLAAGTGATIFQYSELDDKWNAVAELKKDMRDPKDIAKEFEETSAKVGESQAQLDHLEKSVPDFAYVPTMLKELEAFGKQHGIEVLGVRPIPKADPKGKGAKPKKKEAYQEIAIEVKGRGYYKSVQAFVAALEKFPKIVGARAVSLQPKNEPGAVGPTKLDATIELRAFLIPPAKEESPAEVLQEETGQGKVTVTVTPQWPTDALFKKNDSKKPAGAQPGSGK